MEISASLIKKFFDQQCSEKEAKIVADYLLLHPEIIAQQFESDWNEAEDYILSKEEFDSLFNNIRPNPIKKKTFKLGSKIIAIAAVFLLIIVLKFSFFNPNTTENYAQTQTSNTIQPQWQIRTNITNEVINSVLEDGTAVHLQTQASIRFHSFKGLKKRDIILAGEVFFKVAKDKTKPFTVYAGNLTTTALGTQFSIQDNKEKTTIQLFEGKVVIKSIAPNKNWVKDIYLTPGQQLIFNKTNAGFIVKPIGDTNHLNTKKIIKRNNVKLSTTIKTGNWYMFNNQSLRNVFDQLGEIYNIKIECKNLDISNVYFIGRFEKTDSVEVILNNIALLKKLHIEHKNNTYFITK